METFGEALRRLRGDLSTRELARRANVSKSYVSSLEHGKGLPSKQIVASLEKALNAEGQLADTLKRREVLSLIGGSLAAGGVVALDAFGIMGTLESMRHGINLMRGQGDTDIDDWREIVAEYGRTYLVTAPRELLNALVVDLAGVQSAIPRHSGGAAHRELYRAGAMLSSFTARTTANLGHLRESGRWWRTARRLAEDSEDRNAILWIRAEEIIRAGYEQRPLAEVLRLIAEAEARIGGETLFDLGVLAGKAQTLGLVGGPAKADAEAALARLRTSFDALSVPHEPAGRSIFDWSEENLHFTESLTYTYLGDYPRAELAQDRALALYPKDDLRSPAQIELQRAMCLIGMGDVTQGVRHAQTIVTGLPAAHRIRPITDLAQKVLSAVPAAERSQPGVNDYRECLTDLAYHAAPVTTIA